MPLAERRVLRLRAGVGVASTRSRAEVARVTGLKKSRVAKLERSGLRRLSALERAGDCAGAASGSVGSDAPAAAGSSATPGDNATGGRRIAVLDAREASDAREPSGGGRSPLKSLPAISGMPDSPLDFTLLVFVLGLAGVAVMVSRDLKRR
jgi:hypothetical protein